MSRIGFIGLGNMGGPMAANLVKAGHAVTGFDLAAASLDALEAAGGKRAASAADAARGADVVITMLPAGQHVRQVYCGQGGLIDAAKRGGAAPLLIDCSTIDVETARAVGEEAKAAGLDMLDAPVSGGVGGAQEATLTFMVGGPDSGFARGEPILKAMGRNIVHAGASGAGQAAKICNNMILAVNMVALSEGFALATRLGLDHAKLFQIAATSSGQSWALTTYCPSPGLVPTSPANRDYAPGFATALMLKDVKLSQAAAEAVDAPTPLAAHALTFYQALADAGEAGRDFSYVYPWLAAQTRAAFGKG
jgi:3-hydroxyisobutyrate dehydrogenase